MNRPILALDFASSEQVDVFLQQFRGKELFVKVGMQLFYTAGPGIIERLKEAGHHIFLDLKLHDIPNTVKQAMKGLATLGVDMINVHAAGGKKMMEAALEGLDSGVSVGKKRPLCIAVTQLTSTSNRILKDELLINTEMQSTVYHYASIAMEAGLDGIVSSALEVPTVKEKLKNMLTITPGIRLAGDQLNDQSRIVTPVEARKLGSDYIVIGRSVTGSKTPLKAYERVINEWKVN